MRIALITDGIYPYVVGGMQRHSFYLAKYFAANGHHVDLYHTNQSDKNISALDVFTEEERKNISSFVVKFPSFGKMPGHYLKESLAYSQEIYKIYNQQAAVDFIYIKGFAGWWLLNEKSKGKSFPPIGLNFHGYEMFQPPASWVEQLKFSLLLRGPVKFCVKHADYLFSYGGKITEIIEQLGVSRSRIIEIPAGITEDWLLDGKKDFSGRRKFVFVGRFERRKGLPELYTAIKNLGSGLNADFEFVGDIPGTKRIARSWCYYHGAITDSKQLQKIIRSAHVLLCPSQSEGMPNVIMEAMASGLPVIATDVGAVSVVVREDNGWLLESNNPATIERAILAAVSADGNMLQLKSKNAVNAIKEKFLWSKIGALTIKSIEACL